MLAYMSLLSHTFIASPSLIKVFPPTTALHGDVFFSWLSVPLFVSFLCVPQYPYLINHCLMFSLILLHFDLFPSGYTHPSIRPLYIQFLYTLIHVILRFPVFLSDLPLYYAFFSLYVFRLPYALDYWFVLPFPLLSLFLLPAQPFFYVSLSSFFTLVLLSFLVRSSHSLLIQGQFNVLRFSFM